MDHDILDIFDFKINNLMGETTHKICMPEELTKIFKENQEYMNYEIEGLKRQLYDSNRFNEKLFIENKKIIIENEELEVKLKEILGKQFKSLLRID